MGRIYKNGINYSGGIVPSSDAGVYINNLYLSNVNSDVATYKTLSYEIDAVETEMSLTLNASQGEQLGGVYLYPAGIGVTNIDAGVWSSDFTAKVSSTVGGSTSARVECFLRHTNGTETVLFTKTSEPITATEYTLVTTQSIRQVFTTDISDRIGFKIYATTTRPQDTTISYIVGDGRGSHFSTPLPLRHSQLRAKDEETAYQHITSAQKTEMLNPVFTEATAVANIVSGESNTTLWGKVKKMFSFIGTTTLTTTAQTITTAINELNTNLSRNFLNNTKNLKQVKIDIGEPSVIFTNGVGTIALSQSYAYGIGVAYVLNGGIVTNSSVSGSTYTVCAMSVGGVNLSGQYYIKFHTIGY